MISRAVMTFIAAAAVAAAISSPALAQDGQDKARARIGAIATYSEYSEANYMDEKGLLYGISGSYTKPYGALFLSVDGAGLMGFKKYASKEYSSRAIRDTFFELRGLAGGSIAGSASSDLALYGGLGFRRVYDELSRLSILNVAGYDRRTTYYYLPVGIRHTRALAGWLELEASAELDALVYGEQRNYNLPNNWPPSTNRMGAGHGVRASVYVMETDSKANITFGVKYVFWKAYSSDAVNGIIEPENETTEISLIAAAGF